MQQCPKPILPILRAHLNRAKPKTEEARAEVKPAASKPAISKIVISPASEASKQQFSDITLTAESLPFRIGGFTPGNEFLQSDQTHLHIASSGSPLIVSKNHCELSADENGLHLTDLGSRFCTVVNGVSYGRGQGKYAATLDKGANEITLGGPKSPYKITIKCS